MKWERGDHVRLKHGVLVHVVRGVIGRDDGPHQGAVTECQVALYGDDSLVSVAPAERLYLCPRCEAAMAERHPERSCLTCGLAASPSDCAALTLDESADKPILDYLAAAGLGEDGAPQDRTLVCPAWRAR